MPELDGLQATRALLDRPGRPRVMMLTTFDADEYVFQALRIGASGFLLKDAPPDRLSTPCASSAAGDALLEPSITRRLIGRFAQAARPEPARPARLAELTAREPTCCACWPAASPTPRSPPSSCSAENTVKTHVARVLAKLGLRDRVQAVVLAYETGLVTPDPAGGTALGVAGAAAGAVGPRVVAAHGDAAADRQHLAAAVGHELGPQRLAGALDLGLELRAHAPAALLERHEPARRALELAAPARAPARRRPG